MMRPAQVLSLILAGVALAGAGAWLVSRHNGDSAADARGQVLALKQEDLNAVTRLRIFKGDGSHATLARDGSRWMVTERGYAADTGQVRKLLLDLAALQVEEQKTADPALYARLGVEDPTLGLIVGKTSGTRAAFVRVMGTAQSLLASPQLAPDADPRHWLDRTIVDIAPDQVTEVAVQPQEGPGYTLKRSAPGTEPEFTVSPIPKGRELGDPAAPGTQASALLGLQLDDVRKAAAAPAAQATFRTSDGLTVVLGGIQDGETRYLTVVASGAAGPAQARAQDLNARLGGWQFEVAAYRYDALFRPLEQLLKPLPARPAAPSAKPPRSQLTSPSALPFGPQGRHAASPGTVTPEQSH
jgi:hypothetical protein